MPNLLKKIRNITTLALLLISSGARALPGDVVTDRPAPGRTCLGLAHDGEVTWVSDHGLDELLAVDPKTGRVVKRYKSPGYRPAGLAFDGQHLWVVDIKEAQIYRLRTTDGLVDRTIPSPVREPRALAFDGTHLWVSDDATRSIHQVDREDGTTVKELPFPGRSVDGLAFDGEYLWVADRLADKLYAVHLGNAEVVATLPAPGPHVTGLGFDGQNLVAVDYQTDRITTIKRDDTSHLIREDPREAWVVFTHQVRNFGPDPLPSVDIFLGVPSRLVNQEILAGPVFAPAKPGFVTDAFEQKVARFQFTDLKAGADATVRMTVKVRAWKLNQVVYPHMVQSLWKIPAQVRRRYLTDAPKYDLRNPIIVDAVEQAVGKEKSPYWIARKILRHVHEKMHYELVGGWDVAPKVLSRGSGSCSEYSFVFISMCRAAGLPARYVGALVVRKDDASYDDVFHRWVEIYLPPYGWVPVDPSRGDKPTEAGRADSFGRLTADFLITTAGGGGSEYLGWNYNADHRYTCKGRCKVETESLAEWSPEDPASSGRGLSPKTGKKTKPPDPPPETGGTCGDP